MQANQAGRDATPRLLNTCIIDCACGCETPVSAGGAIAGTSPRGTWTSRLPVQTGFRAYYRSSPTQCRRPHVAYTAVFMAWNNEKRWVFFAVAVRNYGLCRVRRFVPTLLVDHGPQRLKEQQGGDREVSNRKPQALLTFVHEFSRD
ncbi:hypothetical protein HPB50_001534 [Hyalomma asiaticum]|uniref:Uncharacterized protein n=1 Tax=Hyalomma asiaticum TaxID=266040 RepID=A0ACB7SJU7_HYAAI|nr:hypothetical protein HPB50_001534 [Hyalomma asiaticum]